LCVFTTLTIARVYAALVWPCFKYYRAKQVNTQFGEWMLFPHHNSTPQMNDLTLGHKWVRWVTIALD
jgi:hypothetical protein